MGALAVTETVSYGVLTYVFPVFLTPMTAEMGWTRAEATGAYSLGVLVAALAAIPAGWWVDRHGPRGLMTAGSLLAAALVLAWSRVEGLAAFYALWAGLGLAMAAVLYEPAFAAVARWFGRRDRARALATVTFVAGFASTVFVPLATWLLARYGWRGAVAVLAGLLATLTVAPHALLLRPPPVSASVETGDAGRAATRGATLRDALRQRGFWRLAAAFSLSVAGPWALAVHLVPMLMERGLGAAAAAGAMAAVGAAKLPGRVGYAALAGRLSGAGATAALFAAQAAALAALATGGAAALWAGVALFGAADGATTPARAALVAETFGAERMGRVGGALALAAGFARAGAPLGAALMRDAVGGYGAVFAALALTSAAAAALVAGAGPPGDDTREAA